ncbi:DUF937 domain-containing protein [Wenzhouxiangella sp. XN24]|uniref:DUF937 domain-containing protein n=1 Tax=Wenzhouxiangella sp. XN24 TaxID=2713569 RepID=UPI0013EBC46C|nr:DUF937 domain-containing protein [Wenzhouxiangella sp. XN24]NGX17181.1 DUF937 domain-containing protein [Wenzhouxiangella sp. XN24]
MQITELLQQMGGLKNIAREIGVDEGQVQSGAEALLPAILGGLKQQAQAQPGGTNDLLGMLGKLGGGSMMDEVLGAQPTNLEQGNQLLGQIFGSKDVSRAVAQNAAGQTGLDPSSLKKMLPMLGMLVAGYMSKEGAAAPQAASPSRAGGLAGILDADGDGNPLNDVMGMLGKFKR